MKTFRIISMLTFAAVTISCGNAAQKGSSTKNVFGTDNRVKMTSTKKPWSSVGMIENPSGFCTGSYVWHNLVLTNAHCVLDGSGKVHNWVKFTAGKGTSKPEVRWGNHVWYGTSNPSANRSKDWAIVRISNSTKRFYFGYKSQGNLNPINVPLNMAGYSGDFWSKNGTAGVHQGCKIKKKTNSYYLHTCDMTGGASGGPMYAFKDGARYIVAINAAQRYCGGTNICKKGVSYKDSRANIAVRVNSFTKKLTELRKANPKTSLSSSIFSLKKVTIKGGLSLGDASRYRFAKSKKVAL